jgi:ATP-dependent RNA helicase RhlE
MTQFSELGLATPLVRALEASGYKSPTPIQAQAIPPVLAGRDICGIAQTGTGKTAAFALPILHHLSEKPKPRPAGGTRVLVLAPTRELASQIAANFTKYGAQLKLQVATVFGGVPINRQIRQMQQGVDVLVATPGRLLDLIDQRALSLRNVEILVLDEADQMLDLGFIHSLKRIASLVPKQRQTLFFSATMPKSIAELGDKYLSDPVKVSVAPVATTAERVDQYVVFINQAEKQALLTMKLREEAVTSALVFTRTKHGADKVVKHLVAAGVKAEAIHGNKSQPQRERTLAAFRSGDINVLVATDIAARGIDVPGVSHVFNFEIPDVAEQYVHRIGRTARAGKAGIALAFVDQSERNSIRDVERLTRVKLQPVALPENFQAEAAKLPKPAAGSGNGGGGERRHDGGNRRPAGGAPRDAAGDPAKRRFPARRRGPGVGTHAGAVRRTGGR